MIIPLDIPFEERIWEMENDEAADFLRTCIAKHEDIAAFFSKELDKEDGAYSELRNDIAVAIECTDEVPPVESQRIDAIRCRLSGDYEEIDLTGMNEFQDQVKEDLEKALGKAKIEEKASCILLVSRMCRQSFFYRCNAIGDRLDGEYLPGKLVEVLLELPVRERKKLLSWAIGKEVKVNPRERYEKLATRFLDMIDDRNCLKLLEKLRLERYEEATEFDIFLFKDVVGVMMKLRDWRGLESLCSSRDDVWPSYAAKAMGDMYMKRRKPDEALPYYIRRYEELVKDDDLPDMDDLLAYIDENIEKFHAGDDLIKVYEDAVFNHGLGMTDHVQTYYRLVPDEEKDALRERLKPIVERASTFLRERVYATDAEIMEMYLSGKVDSSNLEHFTEDLKADWKSFSHGRRSIGCYASLIGKCYEEILVYDDVGYLKAIGSVLDVLATKMGKVGLGEAGRIVETMPDLTAFHEEVYESLGRFPWFGTMKKGNDD